MSQRGTLHGSGAPTSARHDLRQIASCLVRCTAPSICVRYAPACRTLTSTSVKDGGRPRPAREPPGWPVSTTGPARTVRSGKSSYLVVSFPAGVSALRRKWGHRSAARHL